MMPRDVLSQSGFSVSSTETLGADVLRTELEENNVTQTATINGTLCAQCRKLVQHAANIKPGPTVGDISVNETEVVCTTTDLLEDTMSQDCGVCRLFWSMLTAAEKQQMRELKRSEQNHNKIERAAAEHKFEASYEVVYNVVRSEIFELEFHYSSLSPCYPSAHNSIISAITLIYREVFDAGDRPVQGSSTSSTATIETAKEWLSICSQTHTECKSLGGFNPTANEDYFLPSRLVDIGLIGSSNIRICVREELDFSTPYLTLSHCWGKKMPKRLLKGNLEEMRRSIVVQELSRTFQDALTMTRKLGFSYIWIDSLCIIQDCEVDWRKESVLMGQIYSNSYCNLAATSSLDGSDGLFRDRETFPLRQMRLEIGGRVCSLVPNELWSRGVEEMPLNTRAWVFQERTLARRNLHFSSTQLYWECYGNIACESWSTGLPKQAYSGRYGKRNPRITGKTSGAEHYYRDGNMDVSFYRLWSDIVETYSRAALTYEADKLIAISGVATKMQPILDDVYVAGLWRRHLSSELLWTTKTKHHGMRSVQYVAPSWTWASVSHAVDNVSSFIYDDDRDSLVEIVDVSLEPVAGSNAFGQVRSGRIRLSGRLARACLEYSRAEGEDLLVFASEQKYVNDVFIHSDSALSQLCDNEHMELELYCLPLRHKLATDSLNRCALEGLLLEATGRVGEYRRFGTFHAWTKEDATGVLDGCDEFARGIAENETETLVQGKTAGQVLIDII